MVSDLVAHLIRDRGIYYVLTAKISSDPLEGRFGWLRQLSGANFYISCRQLYESEKKIRCLRLIQSETYETTEEKLSLISFEGTTEEEATPFQFSDISVMNIDFLDSADRSTIFFVSGYVARSVSRQRRCLQCRNLLVDDSTVHDDDEDSFLFRDTDRGGLSSPSNICFTLCLVAYVFYQQLSIPEKQNDFLKCKNQQNVFVSKIALSLESNVELSYLLSIKCQNDHSLSKYILRCIFNCFSKNLKRQLNENITHSNDKRKIQKLQCSTLK